MDFRCELLPSSTIDQQQTDLAAVHQIPPDVIKSRLQGAPEGTYKGFLDCAVKTVKADGASALFKGFTPAMLRAVSFFAPRYVAA